MRRVARCCVLGSFVLALSVLVSGAAFAQPAVVPITGVLTSGPGSVDGTVPDVQFSIWTATSGGTRLFTETAVLQVQQGAFVHFLGSAAPLNLTHFDGSARFLEIQIGTEPPMTPRIAFGTTAYAAYARAAAVVPWSGITGVPSGIADGDDDTRYSVSAPLVLNTSTNTISMSTTGCDPGDAWVFTASGWDCRPATAALAAGAGIAVSGSTVSINSPLCTSSQFSRWTGTAWACANDNTGITALVAGPGIGVSGSTVSVASPICAAGHYSRWTGTTWACFPDANSSLGAGDGLSDDGSVMFIDSPTCAPNQYSFWDGTTWSCDSDDGIAAITPGPGIGVTGTTVRTNAITCSGSEYSYWDGAAWRCRADQVGSLTLTQGPGITVSGSTISTNSPQCVAGQFSRWTGTAWTCDTNTGISAMTSGAGIIVTGSGTSRTVSASAATCGAGNYSYWNGSAWLCRADEQGLSGLSEGAGINITGSGASRTVATDAATCGSGNYSYWNGSAWLCRADDRGVTAVTGSTYITVSAGTTPTVSANSALLDALTPVGSIVAWHGNLSGTPGLPTGSWALCDGQVLSLAGSPYNGQTLPNLNGSWTTEQGSSVSGRFLRGGSSSGVFQQDSANRLNRVNTTDSNVGCGAGCTITLPAAGGWSSWFGYYRSNDAVRFELNGVETRPGNMSVRWIIRVK